MSTLNPPPELRDRPRCGVCNWRHDPPECEVDDAPVKAVGELGGRPLWASAVPTRRGGRSIGHQANTDRRNERP